MLKNFKLVIEYDGTEYNGWQRQKTGVTVQGEIEKALATMTNQTVALVGSGRTDAGVHAMGQVANFKCDTRLAPNEFLGGLNSLLPPSIVIVACERVDVDFHARYDAKRKWYQYRLLNRRQASAIHRHHQWHIRKPLDVATMQRAARCILGQHDFKTFEGTGSPRSHTVRHVFRADWQEQGNGWIEFDIEADGFLRYMVRSIVGTLVDVGLSKTNPEEFGRILAAQDRSMAGPTAPPQGLFLMGVDYGD